MEISCRCGAKAAGTRECQHRKHPDTFHWRTGLKHLHWWTWLSGAITIVISIAALIVSYHAYQDQHASDISSDLASKLHYADQASFWVSVGNGKGLPVLVVQNRATEPITDVIVALANTPPSNNPHYSQATNGLIFNLGLIPPCSISSTTMTRDDVEIVLSGVLAPIAADFWDKDGGYATFSEYMYFTDAEGQHWEQTGTGQLYQMDSEGIPSSSLFGPDDMTQPDTMNLNSTYRDATGCS